MHLHVIGMAWLE